MIRKDGLIYFSCDENKENYSQRNNEFVWHNKDAKVWAGTMCNVTSYVMAADYAGFKFPDGKYSQPEDNFADFIRADPRVDTYYKKVMPAEWMKWNAGKKDAYSPMEIHTVLSYAFNLWMDCEKDQLSKFLDNCNFPAALYNNFVKGSLPIIVSGAFPYASNPNKKLNHIVVCTGVVYDEKEFDAYQKCSTPAGYLTPKMIKIDDPYGNVLKDWQGTGNDCYLTWRYCIDNLKPLKSTSLKWAHVFSKPAAIV